MAVDARSPLDPLGVALSAVERPGHPERSGRTPSRAAGVMLVVVSILASAPAAAQGPPEPPGPYVFDFRGVLSGLPDAAGGFPALAATLPLLPRAFGFEVGGHVYGGRMGPARLGFGAMFMRVRSGKDAMLLATPSPSPGLTVSPGLRVEMRAIAPQLSFNFGTADGWSYLSGGVGLTSVTATAVDTTDINRSFGPLLTINAGGGARWFLSQRVAIGFDVRLHRVAAEGTLTAGMQFAIGGGISLR